MKKLYELTNDYQFLEQTIDPEADEELRYTLNSLSVAIDEKVENIAKFVLSLKGDITAIKAEEERLNSRRKTIENRIEWLKVYLLQEMTKVWKQQVKTEVVTVTVKINPPSVQIIDEDAIPPDFRRIIPETWQPDKIKIIDFFKTTGEILPGIEMITNKKSVTIR